MDLSELITLRHTKASRALKSRGGNDRKNQQPGDLLSPQSNSATDHVVLVSQNYPLSTLAPAMESRIEARLGEMRPKISLKKT